MPELQLELTNDELLSTTRAVRKRLDFDRDVPMSAIKECMESAVRPHLPETCLNVHLCFRCKFLGAMGFAAVVVARFARGRVIENGLLFFGSF